MKKQYGWRPDLPDHRDKTYKIGNEVQWPKLIDLRASQTPIYDQGDIGSCTANAIASLFDYVHVKEKLPPIFPSRLFIYYNERKLEGTIHSDSGAEIRDGIKTTIKQGICPEKEWPYIISKFKTQPTANCYKDALKEQVLEYQRLSDIFDYKSCLANGNCFVFGFTVYESFESDAVAKTGIMPMPAKNESSIGGHAVCAVGYDNDKKVFIVKNSWGADWGDKGYFYMPYDYISNNNLCDDFWTITKVE